MFKHYTHNWHWRFLLLLLAGVSSVNLKAQVSGYTYSTSSGTYAPITGTVANTGTFDDNNFSAIALGFTFGFNGTNYTTCNINSNGFISFGTNLPGTSTYLPLSSTTSTAYDGCIAAFARDMQSGYIVTGNRTTGSNQLTNVANIGPLAVGMAISSGTGWTAGTTISSISGSGPYTLTMSANATSTGTAGTVTFNSGTVSLNPSSISYATSGSAGSRVFTVQYKNVKPFGSTVSLNFINFQIKLYETTNIIEVIYGNSLANLTTYSPQVGLRGASNADYNNRTSTTSWSSSSAGSVNTSTMAFVSTGSVVPASGLTYTWTPPAGFPTDMGVTSIINPAATNCGGATNAAVVTIKNFGTQSIDFSLKPVTVKISTTGPVTQTLSTTLNSGTLAISGTQNVTISNSLDLSSFGNYSIKAWTEVTGDGKASNDTSTKTSSNITPTSFPTTVNFENAGLLPSGFSGNMYASSTHGNGAAGTYGATFNLYSSTPVCSLVTVKYNSLQSSSRLQYDYRIVDYTSYPSTATTLASGNYMLIQISTDCGSTFTTIDSIHSGNHASNLSWATRTVDLSAYSGSYAVFRVRGQWASGDYYLDLDNLKLFNVFATDIGVSSIIDPTPTTCGGPNSNANVIVKNYGTSTLDFSVTPLTIKMATSGAVSQTVSTILNSGTLSSGATQTINISNTLNLSSNGTYNIKSWTELSVDSSQANDTLTGSAIKTAPTAIPVTINFENAGALPTGWSGNMFASNTHGNGASGTYGLTYNLYSSSTTCNIQSVKYGTITSTSKLSYDYRIVDYTSYPATPTTLASGNYMLVQASFDCGATYVTLDSIHSGNHTPSMSWLKRSISLGAYAGSDIILRFKGQWASSGDYYWDLDNVKIFTPPATDIAAASLASPTPRYYGTNRTVTFRFQNVGTGAIDFSTNPLSVVSSVAGAATQSFSTASVNSGTLAPDSFINVTVSTTLNLTTAGTATFRFKANLTGDGDNTNDSTGARIVVAIPVDYAVTRTTGITYTSIMGSGTNFGFTGTSGDDQTSPAISLPFSFTYQGQTVSSFRACTNGWITLNGATVTSTSWTNSIAGNTSTQNAILAPFWEDLVCTGHQPSTPYTSATQLNQSMKYLVSGSAPNRILTVEWAGMEKYSYPGPSLNFQVKLYENGSKIEYIYGNMSAFDGTSLNEYSYSIGMNGFTTSTATADEFISLQSANSLNFGTVAQNSLSWTPECYISYTFVPGSLSAGAAAAAVSNDSCGSPIALNLDADAPNEICQTFRTSGATGSPAVPSCFAGTPGNADDDVWFNFTISQTKTIKFDLRSGPVFDGVFQVLSGACGSMTSLACVNKTGDAAAEDTILTLTAGTYYIRVYHAGTGSSSSATGVGQFGLYIYDAPITPANDNINNAQILVSGSTCNNQVYSTRNSNASVQSVCTGTMTHDIWFKFTAEYAAHTITVTPTTPGTTFNPAVQVYDAGVSFDTTTMTTISCQNASGTNQPEVIAYTNLVPGRQYAIRVYNAIGGVGGTGRFNICVTHPGGYWKGNTSNVWINAANWSDNAVPTIATRVVIGSGRPNYPVLSGAVFAKNVNVLSGGSLTMNAGSKLTIADSFQVSGTTTLTSGTIVLNSAVNIPALTYNALTLAANSGTYNLLGNIATNNLFSKTASGSTLNLGANTLTINTDLYVVGDVTGTGKIFIDRPIGGFATLSGNGNLNNLEVSVAGGGLRITDTVLVNGSLIFTAGGLTLRTGSKLSIGTNVSSTGNIVTTAGSNLYAQPGSHFGIFGNGASSPISNLSINCAGTFTLDYPKGISLGANMSLSGPTNMVNGKLDQNGFNLDLGAISNTNFSLNTTNGRFTNRGATGYLRINGAVGSPAINGIKIDSVAFASVAYPSGVSIDSSIYVKSFWAISNGKVNLNGSNIILSSSASISEQPGMVFFGATGSITTTRNIAAAVTSMTNIAGLGLRITTSAAPGVTTLVRKHNVLTNNGNSSIKRNFSLTVSSPITLGNIEIVYDSTEINGLNRSRLKMNKLASSVWSKIGTGASSNNATPTGWLASSNQSVSGTVVFTASDSSNSLSPVFINPDMSAGVSANASINAVYPNPFSEQFTVDLNASENSNATIQLFDIHGKLVFNQRYPVVMGQNLVHLKTAELASGVYLISVLNNQEVRTFRIVKQ